MFDKEDWVLRPVMRGMVKYESLIDGTLTLSDIALLNEAIDVESENTYRAHKAMEAKAAAARG